MREQEIAPNSRTTNDIPGLVTHKRSLFSHLFNCSIREDYKHLPYDQAISSYLD